MNNKYLTIKYWLLFIVLPIFILIFVFVYFVIPLVLFVIAVIILMAICERGIRYYKKNKAKGKKL